ELLQEIAPEIKRILAVVAKNERNAQASFERLVETAQKLEIEVLRRDVTSREEIEHVLRAIPPGAMEAMYHVPSSLVSAHIDLLIQKAKQEKLPLIVHEESMVDQGALASYGGHSRPMGAQAAKLVAQILRGAQPAELPIQTPDTLFLAFNLTTAKAIELELPSSVLERADRLVEYRTGYDVQVQWPFLASHVDPVAAVLAARGEQSRHAAGGESDLAARNDF